MLKKQKPISTFSHSYATDGMFWFITCSGVVVRAQRHSKAVNLVMVNLPLLDPPDFVF